MEKVDISYAMNYIVKFRNTLIRLNIVKLNTEKREDLKWMLDEIEFAYTMEKALND